MPSRADATGRRMARSGARRRRWHGGCRRGGEARRQANEPRLCELGRSRRRRRASATRRTSAANSASASATGAVGNAATAAALGDFFQYAIDHPVSLARQKSAMLPIVGKDVEGRRSASTTRPCRPSTRCSACKFKNTSGAHLNQGPITVFEGSVYAGDTRVLDVQPNEERLVTYAIDLGTEVDPQAGPGTQKITIVKAVKGIVTTVDQGDRGEEVQDRQPPPDRPDAADRAPEPDQPAVQAGRHRQADGGHAGRLPLPDAGEGRRDQDLHGQGGAGRRHRRCS